MRLNERLRRELIVLFDNEEGTQLETFLNRAGGFSLAGQIALVEMIDLVQERGVSFDEILRGLELEWTNNWRFQESKIRGSRGAEGKVGIENTVSIENFYYFFKVRSPLTAVPLEIPMEAFRVDTRHALYYLGDANLKGERDIHRSERPLQFDRCKVHQLAIGKSMLVERFDHAIDCWWWTTPICDFSKGVVL